MIRIIVFCQKDDDDWEKVCKNASLDKSAFQAPFLDIELPIVPRIGESIEFNTGVFYKGFKVVNVFNVVDDCDGFHIRLIIEPLD